MSHLVTTADHTPHISLAPMDLAELHAFREAYESARGSLTPHNGSGGYVDRSLVRRLPLEEGVTAIVDCDLVLVEVTKGQESKTYYLGSLRQLSPTTPKDMSAENAFSVHILDAVYGPFVFKRDPETGRSIGTAVRQFPDGGQPISKDVVSAAIRELAYYPEASPADRLRIVSSLIRKTYRGLLEPDARELVETHIDALRNQVKTPSPDPRAEMDEFIVRVGQGRQLGFWEAHRALARLSNGVNARQGGLSFKDRASAASEYGRQHEALIGPAALVAIRFYQSRMRQLQSAADAHVPRRRS
jgi:hypothetical protein